jgi:hypothetical protein
LASSFPEEVLKKAIANFGFSYFTSAAANAKIAVLLIAAKRFLPEDPGLGRFAS